MVSTNINLNAYKFDMPSTLPDHSVFHVSLPDSDTPPVRGQQSSEPHPVIVEEGEEGNIDRVLDST
jgi:hypothetical protein